MEGPKPELGVLTYIGLGLNSATARGAPDLSFAEVHAGLEGGTILRDIETRCGSDLSPFSAADNDQGTRAVAALAFVAAGWEGRERRKTGIESSGLHFLSACVFEAIYHGYWVPEPKVR